MKACYSPANPTQYHLSSDRLASVSTSDKRNVSSHKRMLLLVPQQASKAVIVWVGQYSRGQNTSNYQLSTQSHLYMFYVIFGRAFVNMCRVLKAGFGFVSVVAFGICAVYIGTGLPTMAVYLCSIQPGHAEPLKTSTDLYLSKPTSR